MIVAPGIHQRPKGCPTCWDMLRIHRVSIILHMQPEPIWYITVDDIVCSDSHSKRFYVQTRKWQYSKLCCVT